LPQVCYVPDPPANVVQPFKGTHMKRTALRRIGLKPRQPVVKRQKRTTAASASPWCSGAKLKALVAQVTARHGWFCHYCYEHLSWETITLDHKIPRSQSGSDEPANLLPCCRVCNSIKGARSYAWMVANSKARQRTRKVTSYLRRGQA
jgi:5-methylcytosine-specific restriction endonuclease McrA